jgi:hypothetical protein
MDSSERRLGINIGIAMVIPSEKILRGLEVFIEEEEKEAKRERDKERSCTVMESVPRSNVTFQESVIGFEMPVPAKVQVSGDLRKASRKKN